MFYPVITGLDYLIQHLDNGYCVDAIYLDFQKKIDTVPHQHLLQQKLTSLGIHSNLLEMSYLTENSN